MIDLKDVTFNIPVKIDTKDRFDNLNVLVDYLKHYTETNISICEQDADKCKDLANKKNIKYMQIKRGDGLFYKTRMFNLMARESNTKYIVCQDIDIIFDIDNLIQAVELLRQNKAQVALPYSGSCFNIDKKYHKKIQQENSLDPVGDIRVNGDLMNPIAVGGCVLFNKDAYFEGGMANENFISWGWEDIELIARFEILGYEIRKVHGLIYHLYHERTSNSSVGHEHHKKNEKEFRRIKRLNKNQLRDEIKKWAWVR